jgi:hypothetical protein
MGDSILPMDSHPSRRAHLTLPRESPRRPPRRCPIFPIRALFMTNTPQLAMAPLASSTIPSKQLNYLRRAVVYHIRNVPIPHPIAAIRTLRNGINLSRPESYLQVCNLAVIAPCNVQCDNHPLILLQIIRPQPTFGAVRKPSFDHSLISFIHPSQLFICLLSCSTTFFAHFSFDMRFNAERNTQWESFLAVCSSLNTLSIESCVSTLP